MAWNGDEVRVGVVGADARASWAGVSHVPALKALPGVRLVAVATQSADSAREAAEAHGVSLWFDGAESLARSPEVDVVTVAVKVPAHRTVVEAALAAGKAVYCESPLGRTAAEGEALAALARAAGVPTAVGLQGRLNPAARRAAEMVASGAIGRPLTARVVSTSAGFGPVAPAAYAYFDEAASGANLLTITGGHTLDLVEAILGELVEVEARAPTLFPEVHLFDTGATSRREVPDHLAVLGRTASGAEVVVDVEGGRAPEEAEFSLVVRGTEGTLRLTGGALFGFQGGDLALSASVPFAPPEPQAAPGAQGPAINVAEAYARLARDVREGTRTAIGFDHGARSSRLMEAVARVADARPRVGIAA